MKIGRKSQAERIEGGLKAMYQNRWEIRTQRESGDRETPVHLFFLLITSLPVDSVTIESRK